MRKLRPAFVSGLLAVAAMLALAPSSSHALECIGKPPLRYCPGRVCITEPCYGIDP